MIFIGVILFYLIIYLNKNELTKYMFYIIINLIIVGIFISKYAFIIVLSFIPIYFLKDKTPNIYKGPIILIYNGKFNLSNLAKNNIHIKSIIKYLYDNNTNLDSVRLMYLDNFGKYNLFTDSSSYNNIKPLILNGILDKNNLKENNKSVSWLYKVLKNSKINIKDVYYGYIFNDKLYVVEK